MVEDRSLYAPRREKRFRECDFAGVEFDATDFSGCSFPDSRLSYLNFSTAPLSQCNFSGVILVSCSFYQLKAGQSFVRKMWNLSGCSFEDVDLSSSVFDHCILKGTNFSGSTLVKAIFEKCELFEVDFERADLSGTNFDDCRIKKCVLDLCGFITLGNARGFVLGEGVREE